MSVDATMMGPVGMEWRGLVRLGGAAAVFVVDDPPASSRLHPQPTSNRPRRLLRAFSGEPAARAARLGGTFATSYVLGATSTLLFSAMMGRHHIFGQLPGLVGVLTGLTTIVPANAGPIGLTISRVSLLPTAAWLIMLIPHFSASQGNHAEPHRV